MIENEYIMNNLDIIIEKSLRIKKYVVEHDEKEKGLRRILNFGHTIGHGIESYDGLHGLYHGECVALGMLPMCEGNTRERLLTVLQKANLPTKLDFEAERIFEAVTHDKKLDGETLNLIYVPEIGTFEMKKTALSDFRTVLEEVFHK